MATKSKSSNTLKRCIALLCVLIFAFLCGFESIGAVRANVFYKSASGKPCDTVAFINSLRYDIGCIADIYEGYTQYGGKPDYEKFMQTEEAESVKSSYESRRERALKLYADIKLLKERCPVDLDENRDLVDGYLNEYESTATGNEIIIKDTYSDLDEWVYDYARLRNEIFSLVSDATNEKTINKDIDTQLGRELSDRFYSSEDGRSYSQNMLDKTVNLKYLVRTKSFSFSNIEDKKDREVFAKEPEKDSLFYAQYSGGSLLSPPSVPDADSHLLSFLKNSSYTNFQCVDEEFFKENFGDDCEVYIAVPEDLKLGDAYYTAVENFKNATDKSAGIFIALSAVFAVLSFAAFVIFCALTGKKDDGTFKIMPTDKIPFIIVLALVASALVCCAFAAASVMYFDYSSRQLTEINYLLTPNSAKVVFGLLIAAISGGLLIFASYIERNARAHVLSSRFFIGMLYHGMQKTNANVKKLSGSIRYVRFRTVALICLFVLFNLIAGIFFGMFTDDNEEGPALLVAVNTLVFNIATLGYGIKYLSDINRLGDIAAEIKKGNYDIGIEPNSFLKPLRGFAHNLVSCRDGIKSAVDEAIKGEKLKTELITNVSHDLKTPLTSIINYVSLLKMCNIEGEDEKKYLDVLESKSQKLKRLIEDLTEASKATTGNIHPDLSPVDLKELALQAVGENSDALESVGLDLVFSERSQSIRVLCSARHTLRVIDNLFSNAKKYSMPDSRVYVDVYTEGIYGVFSMKNISREKLNIPPEELTERFVRGDASRTTEGSGLGLSIARSYTELQDGIFTIEIDGDLFKACVKLPVYDSAAADADTERDTFSGSKQAEKPAPGPGILNRIESGVKSASDRISGRQKPDYRTTPGKPIPESNGKDNAAK